MAKIRVGIIGTGRSTSISRGHLKGISFSDNAELTAVYNISRESLVEWCDKMNVDKSLCCSSLEELFGKCDAVTVATPNNSHADYVVKCLAEGKHILVEKPISNDGKDIPRILEASRASDRVGYVNLCYRRIPGIRMIHDYIASGEAGRIYTIRHNMGGSRLANESIPLEWRFQRAISGTGCIGDFGSHALDIMHYIAGDGVSFEKIQAFEDTFIKERMFRGENRAVENEDVATVIAKLSNGALYSLLLSRVGTTPSRLEVVAEKAILRYSMDEPDRMYLQKREKGGAYEEEECVISTDCRQIWHETPLSEVPYLATAENVACFLNTVEKKGKPEISLEYGCHILEEIETIDRIASSN